ncbi:MAG TPA: hypothetical protein VK821_04400 [Dehalococcoidia bacterium]|nr:hypothetical protein [Dehalococcoidia bacterium]
MSDLVVTRTVQRVELDANAVLKQAWRLYKRLFTRSVLMGAAVLGVMHLFQALAGSSGSGFLVAVFALVLSVAGIAFLQGGLVEIVRGLHTDGDDDASFTEVLGRASGKIWKLVCLSIVSALGIGLGFLLLVVPGFVLMTRWAVGVPVAMLEEGSARDALRRSREIVSGNGLSVFKVLFAVGALTALVQIPFTLAAAGAGPFNWWLATTLASALTAPYAAHALIVVYYALVQPGRPVVLEPGQRWQSVWDEQKVSSSEGEEQPSVWDEYEARFDEREQRWGGGQ